MSFSNVLTRFVGLRPLSRRAVPNLLFYTSSSRHARNFFTNEFNTLIDGLKAPKDLLAIHNNFPALVTQLREQHKHSTVAPPLNVHHLISILQKLGESGRPADLQRIEDILADMPLVFGVKPSPRIHTAVLHALKKNGNLLTMHRWLLNIPSRPGNFDPTIEQFHILLEAGRESGSFKQMRNIVLSMRQAGSKPTIETFKILVRARWQFAADEDKIPHTVVFSTILEDMKREGLRYDQAFSDLLFASYADRGMSTHAEQIRALYEHQFSDGSNEGEETMEWISKLSQASHHRGVKEAVTTFRSLEKDGCKADPVIVRAILRHSRTLADVEYVEKELKVKPILDVYSLVISNCVRIGNVPGALALYDRAKGEGLTPRAPLVAPLIKLFCQMNDGVEPREESLDKAIVLYEELSSHHPSDIDIPANEETSYLERSAGPDINIYRMLLRGLASSSNTQKYFPVALSLSEDMDARGLTKKDSNIAASNIILHMRNATNFKEALDAYHLHRGALDGKGYAVVLHVYSQLTFGNDIHIPSLLDYFGIVRDMRHAKFEITAEVYSIFLRQLAQLATRLSKGGRVGSGTSSDIAAEFLDLLVTTTRRTHDLLTLDANISPSAYVWNQLMDTYQRLGCFGDAYRVWELMYLSGKFDHVSVSIILDACGFAGAWQVAQQVRRRLAAEKFRLNHRNWYSWIECLCRLGRLDDAVKAVCVEMGKNGEVSADVESVTILVKFARKANQQDKVTSRIRQFLPELWTSLPDEFRVT